MNEEYTYSEKNKQNILSDPWLLSSFMKNGYIPVEFLKETHINAQAKPEHVLIQKNGPRIGEVIKPLRFFFNKQKKRVDYVLLEENNNLVPLAKKIEFFRVTTNIVPHKVESAYHFKTKSGDVWYRSGEFYLGGKRYPRKMRALLFDHIDLLDRTEYHPAKERIFFGDIISLKVPSNYLRVYEMRDLLSSSGINLDV